jgi:hypothetical protein
LDQANPASTAATESTLITVNDADVVKEWQNHGVAQHRIRGDGRVWFRVLTGAPSSPVAGDTWLELDSGTTYLRFYDGSSTVTVTSTSQALQITTSAALLQGMAVRASGAGLAYAQAFVDGSKVYKLIGIMAADALISTPGTVLVAGDHLDLPDWSLIVGAATLTVGSDYWLTSTPGRYDVTPDTTVAARVGRAVTTTTLLVKPDLVVVS